MLNATKTTSAKQDIHSIPALKNTWGTTGINLMLTISTRLVTPFITSVLRDCGSYSLTMPETRRNLESNLIEKLGSRKPAGINEKTNIYIYYVSVCPPPPFWHLPTPLIYIYIYISGVGRCQKGGGGHTDT